jgi:hypothetical protein
MLPEQLLLVELSESLSIAFQLRLVHADFSGVDVQYCISGLYWFQSDSRLWAPGDKVATARLIGFDSSGIDVQYWFLDWHAPWILLLATVCDPQSFHNEDICISSSPKVYCTLKNCIPKVYCTLKNCISVLHTQKLHTVSDNQSSHTYTHSFLIHDENDFPFAGS